MGDGWTGETFATFVAAVISAVVGVVSVAATVLEARASRRNTRILAERSGWWERWSWIAERAWSRSRADRKAASVMLEQVQTAPWASVDDRRTALAVSMNADERKDD
jgi:hypothetical protein